MKIVRPSDVRSMERLVVALQSSEPTYTDLGATLAGQEVDGFTRTRHEAVLGQGAATFSRAVDGLQRWKAHGLLGFAVFPKDASVRIGSTVVVTMGTSLFAVAAPCRIVATLDEADRWGFAYGTLPGHPEQGEEAFEVTMAADQMVRFAITALSRPADPLVRLAGPIGRRVQTFAVRGYLKSLSRFVDREAR